MASKRRHEEETAGFSADEACHVERAILKVAHASENNVQRRKGENMATKRARRPISPPPLRRGNVVTNDIDKAEPTRPTSPISVSNRPLPGMYHKDRDRAIYMNWSEETELSLVMDKPHSFGIPTAWPKAPHALNEKINEILREASRTMNKDTGDIITVDYVDTITKPASNGFDSSNLCSRCQKVIRESSVMNRPWRRIVSVRDDGPVRIQEEEPVQYHGQKCNVFGHHGQLGSLRKSALSGCHLCSLLDAFDSQTPIVYCESTRTPYVLKVIYAKDHAEGPGVLVLEAKGFPTKATYLMFEETKYKICGTLEQNRTDSEAVVALGHKWLHKCLEEHEACAARSAGAPAFLPTRLIKVVGAGGSVQSISLKMREDIALGTRYLTLSHCWGGAEIVKLTEATLADFQKDIAIARLPKNFLEAVHITSLLGHEYIWIDSLCIIQDSVEDWETEAATMGSVYLYSTCTIAAVGAQDSHGGCFATRSAQSLTPCQLIPKSNGRPEVFAENWQHRPEPLHIRAWVVQERALSVRTLNFGTDMISWDCISARASERDPEMESTMLDDSLKRTFNKLLDSEVSGKGQSAWIDAWWKLVREYSSCNLSFVTDKWAAIKGLASAIEKNTQRKLAHGLWEFNIADELLWTVSSPRKERLKITQPSWSWLSINGTVHRRRYNYAMDFRLEARASVLNLDDSAAESVAKDAIRIRARMVPLRWALRAIDKENTPSYKFYLVDDRKGSFKGRPDDWYGKWIPDTVADESWETWSLQIVAADTLQLKGSAGLVVVPVEGKQNTWTRVGFYEINWRDESHRDEDVPKRWLGYERDVILV